MQGCANSLGIGWVGYEVLSLKQQWAWELPGLKTSLERYTGCMEHHPNSRNEGPSQVGCADLVWAAFGQEACAGSPLKQETSPCPI